MRLSHYFKKFIPLLLLAFSTISASVKADFFRACLRGDREKVYELYEKAENKLIYAKDKDSNTGLHLACCSKKGGEKEEIVAFFISKGANVNAQNRFDSTPFMIAVCNANYEAVELLLKCPELNPNLQDKSTYSALQHAVTIRSPPMIKLVLSHPKTNPNFGTGDGASPLHFAAMWGYIEEAKALIDDPRTDLNVTQHDPRYGGATPLHFAALQVQPKIVQMILERGGANIHATLFQGLYEGFTPLHFAAMNPNTIYAFETVKLLLNAGADPKKKCKVGKTPMDLTEKTIIKALMKNPKKQLNN